MKVGDKIQIAFQNVNAGRQMVRKIIFGMTFIVMLIFSILTILQSYVSYTEAFNQNNASNCYYYTEICDQEVQDATTNRLLSYTADLQERYQARETSVLCTLQPRDRELPLEAGSTGLILDGAAWQQIRKSFQGRRKIYQDIQSSGSLISLALYQPGMSVFADKITEGYGDEYLWGCYPQNPGEIMLDDYILEVYGVLGAETGKSIEDLLGKKVSIYAVDEAGDKVVLDEYLLTGIFRGDLLSVRESVTSKDYHLEHIYVNLRDGDLERFVISSGSIRLYYDDYLEYVKHYDHIKDILQLNISQINQSDDMELKLTVKGMEYCLLYWIMHNLGKLLVLVAAVIGLVITFSVFYIIRFYLERNARYLSMLRDIGMERRDRAWILSIEMCYMMFVATLIGVCLSAVFLTLLNVISGSALNFPIALDVGTGIISVLASWLYVWLCLCLAMRKE